MDTTANGQLMLSRPEGIGWRAGLSAIRFSAGFVRMQVRLLNELDDWRKRQPRPMSRPAALRKLAAIALLGNGE